MAIGPALSVLLDCECVVFRGDALEVLAKLEPRGVELADGGAACIKAPEHLEDRLGRADVRLDPLPEATIVKDERLSRSALVRPDKLTCRRLLLCVALVLVVLRHILLVDDSGLEARLELRQH